MGRFGWFLGFCGLVVATAVAAYAQSPSVTFGAGFSAIVCLGLALTPRR